MAALAGRKAVIKVCTTSSGTFAAVKGINSVTLSRSGAEIDVSELGDAWKSYLRGMLDGGLDIQASYRPDDTDGQVVIQTAFTADSALFVQYLYDGTNGVQFAAIVTAFPIDGGVDSKLASNITIKQNGAPTTIPA